MAPDRVRAGKVASSKSILFDSSFLIAIMEHPTQWEQDITDKVGLFEPVVLQPVFRELVRLAAARGGRSRFASAAVQYIRDSKLRVEPALGRDADDELMSKALGDGSLVATIDGELIAQLRAAKVRVVSLRSGRVEIQ